MDNVPRIVTFSNSAWPLFAESSLQPLTPLAKSPVSIIPVECIFKFVEYIFELSIFQPPIVPDSAFNTPALVTLNGALENVLCPNWIPVSASTIKTSSVAVLPRVIDLPAASNVKFVAVRVFPDNSNPAIFPPVNNTWEPVILPPAETLNALDDINDTGSDVAFDADILQYGE